MLVRGLSSSVVHVALSMDSIIDIRRTAIVRRIADQECYMSMCVGQGLASSVVHVALSMDSIIDIRRTAIVRRVADQECYMNMCVGIGVGD